MSQALTKYHVLFESLRSRRQRPVVYKGIDRWASRFGVLIRHRRTSLPFLREQAALVIAHGPELRSFSEGALDHEIERLREFFLRGRQDQPIVNRAFAAVREVARRATNEEAFPVQIMGAMALYHGRIVEMLTGEGKTLTGSLAAPLIAWQRRHLHVFTVNDYLAARDAQSRRIIYDRCGVSVGAITQDTDPAERFQIYSRGIVYGTPKQITADWLRDQIHMGGTPTPWSGRQGMLSPAGGQGPMVPGLRAALVDEADAVLIDEGVVPLIIARSRREDEMGRVYKQACTLASKLDEGPDFEVDTVRRRATIKRRGEQRLAQMFEELVAAGEPIWKATRRAEELVRQALVARHCYLSGQQYQIVDGKVVIVDEYTGRFLPDRSWEHGLHQAVEAKEGLEVTADRETLARMSFQKFFRSYPFLCGMTGTAADAVAELEGVYERPVTVIPTNKPVIREARPTRIFATQREKWDAIVESIAEVNKQGRPSLVGTRSIAASELLSRLLTERSIPHQVLNANFDKEEAELISRAGKGAIPNPSSPFPTDAAVTVATNMAGRGTDILLDLAARRAGGLHVILTEMHGAKRVDRQFIGRAGRQGDPGSSQIFVSLEDELLVKNMRPLARLLKSRSGRRELTSSPLLRSLFTAAQRRSQNRDRLNRESVLRQDDWMEQNLPGVG
jgi:preprotein translocase subunit SecA